MELWLTENVDDSNVRDSVTNLLSEHPNSRVALTGLAQYFDSKLQQSRKVTHETGQLPKKRKIGSESKPIATIDNVSFSQPKRKKYTIRLSDVELQLVSNTNGTDVEEAVYVLEDVALTACIPTPQRESFTFCLFMRPSSHQPAYNVVTFSVDDKCLITLNEGSNETVRSGYDKLEKHELTCLLLKEHGHLEVCRPDPTLFCASGAPTITGKTEERLYVNACRNAQDGVLYFLPSGILFGFKKPTLFIPTKSLAEVVVSNVMDRTFDLTLSLRPGCPSLGMEGKPDKSGKVAFPFSMITKDEYAGIESYRQRLGIDDKSMAEERKAQETKTSKGNSVGEINEEDEEEEDDDFEPRESDDESLEYDSNAGSDDQSGEGHTEVADKEMDDNEEEVEEGIKDEDEELGDEEDEEGEEDGDDEENLEGEEESLEDEEEDLEDEEDEEEDLEKEERGEEQEDEEDEIDLLDDSE